MKTLEERGAALMQAGAVLGNDLGGGYRILIVAVGTDGMISHVAYGADEILLQCAEQALRVIRGDLARAAAPKH